MDNKFSPIDQKIIDELNRSGAMKAKELSKILGIDKTIINHELYGPLKEYCSLNEEYYWSINKEKLTKITSSFDERKYFDILTKGDLLQLDDYLTCCGNDILKTPQMLFVKPVISGLVLENAIVDRILDYLKQNGIDLNSQEYFQNRNDDLKGIDLAGGCVCYPIYYFVQGQKRVLKSLEVEMYSHFVIKARENGWITNNKLPNNKEVHNLIYLLLSRGNKELQPVYDALFSNIEPSDTEKDETPYKIRNVQEYDANRFYADDSEVERMYEDSNTDDNVDDKNLNNTLMEETKILLNSIAINGYIDPSFLSVESVLGNNIRNNLKNIGCETLDELIKKCDLECGPIVGDVQYSFADSSDKDTSRISDEMLDQLVFGLSNRAMNRLMMYGVRTNRDLLNLDLEEFSQKRGVGAGVIDDIKKRRTQLLKGTEIVKQEETVQEVATQENQFEKESMQEELYTDDELMEQQITGLSSRTMNRLMMRGIRTNRELLNLDLESFYQSPGVGPFEIAEIEGWIAELKKAIKKDQEPVDSVNESDENSTHNIEISPRSELTEVIFELQKLYDGRPKEHRVEQIFINNPKYKEYYDLLTEKSMELFGCELSEHLSRIGLIKENDFSSEDEILNSDSQNTSLGEDLQKGKTLDYNDEKECDNVNENSTEEFASYNNETSQNDEEVMQEDLMGMSSDYDTENIFWLLDSLFKGKIVNLKCIEGTSLQRRLLEQANQNKVTLEDYLNNQGYSVDNEAIEKYKMSYNRIYDKFS